VKCIRFTSPQELQLDRGVRHYIYIHLHIFPSIRHPQRFLRFFDYTIAYPGVGQIRSLVRCLFGQDKSRLWLAAQIIFPCLAFFRYLFGASLLFGDLKRLDWLGCIAIEVLAHGVNIMFLGEFLDTSTDTDTTLPVIGSTTNMFGCLMLKFERVSFVVPLPDLGLEGAARERARVVRIYRTRKM